VLEINSTEVTVQTEKLVETTVETQNMVEIINSNVFTISEEC